MEATVVREVVSGDYVIKDMSDGRIIAERIHKRPGSQYGTYVTIDGEVTEEKLAKAKEQVVEDVCNIIRDIAKERDDFFIIKQLGDTATVAHKFILPTVEQE